jgi:hypothetical protein
MDPVDLAKGNHVASISLHKWTANVSTNCCGWLAVALVDTCRPERTSCLRYVDSCGAELRKDLPGQETALCP